MVNWGRKFSSHLAESDRAVLVSAMWDGNSWSIPQADRQTMERLATEGLVRERKGVWTLTLNGHRHRRAGGS
ncbi:MAG: hypothetical protein EOP66_08150 [Sphingomonas sp.]|nr:MAG: hypothetical protein EOP66_08150 [Sphingomonas sp.]